MAHLPAPIAAVRGAVRNFLDGRRRAGTLRDDDLVLVACSGGADSVALAAALAFLAPRMGLRAGLVTVDHAMQDGSADQATKVVRLGADLGLEPTRAATVDPGTVTASGPEGTARELRYAALERVAEEYGANAVLLGHTMEDQAETVLLGLSRGAGPRAVAGMPAARGRFWRPLLSVRRRDTEDMCTELGLPVWEDPTNRPDGPWRTAAGAPLPRAALRHEVIPDLARALGQDPVPALARTARLAREDSDHLDALAAAHFHLITTDPTAIDIKPVEALPPALRWRTLRELCLRAGAPAAALGMTHVLAVDALITDWRGQAGISLPGGLRARRSCGRLYVITPPHLEQM